MELEKIFVPYKNGGPASTLINGHKVLIISEDRTTLANQLELLGASGVRAFKGSSKAKSSDEALAKLAKKTKSNVVVAPAEVEIADVIKSLKQALPWVH